MGNHMSRKEKSALLGYATEDTQHAQIFHRMAICLTLLKDMHLPVFKFRLQDLLLLWQTVISDVSQTSH
jgi:hypothetical protein